MLPSSQSKRLGPFDRQLQFQQESKTTLSKDLIQSKPPKRPGHSVNAKNHFERNYSADLNVKMSSEAPDASKAEGQLVETRQIQDNESDPKEKHAQTQFPNMKGCLLNQMRNIYARPEILREAKEESFAKSKMNKKTPKGF